MIKGPILQKGDKVAFVAPARSIQLVELKECISFFESIGWIVFFENELFEVDNQLAGTDSERAAYFQKLIDDTSIKAIFCVRGGYGTSRIIDLLDFENLKKHPKWIIGFSDITVLLNHLFNQNISSIHASMPLWFFRENAEKSTQYLFSFLQTGKAEDILFPSHSLNKTGKAEGKLVGGNLSVLTHLIGTKSFPNLENCILFIEDLDEYLYHIDRMLVQLKRNQVFKKISGLVIGSFSDMKDNTIPWGKSAYEIIAEHTADCLFPIAFDFPAGHCNLNYPLIIGKEYSLEVSNEGVNFSNS